MFAELRHVKSAFLLVLLVLIQQNDESTGVVQALPSFATSDMDVAPPAERDASEAALAHEASVSPHVDQPRQVRPSVDWLSLHKRFFSAHAEALYFTPVNTGLSLLFCLFTGAPTQSHGCDETHS